MTVSKITEQRHKFILGEHFIFSFSLAGIPMHLNPPSVLRQSHSFVLLVGLPPTILIHVPSPTTASAPGLPVLLSLFHLVYFAGNILEQGGRRGKWSGSDHRRTGCGGDGDGRVRETQKSDSMPCRTSSHKCFTEAQAGTWSLSRPGEPASSGRHGKKKSSWTDIAWITDQS